VLLEDICTRGTMTVAMMIVAMMTGAKVAG
jgi:hypothetical protein